MHVAFPFAFQRALRTHIFSLHVRPMALPINELVFFKGLVKLRSKPQVLPDIIKLDQKLTRKQLNIDDKGRVQKKNVKKYGLLPNRGGGSVFEWSLSAVLTNQMPTFSL